MRRSRGRRAARLWDTASWKCGQSGAGNFQFVPEERQSCCAESELSELMNSEVPSNLAHATAEEVARRSYGKLVAFLATRTRDVAGAEDALSEAFASALADWPQNGCPANPEAWLLTVARRKIIDVLRGRLRHERAAEELRSMDDGLAAAQDSSKIPDQR